MLRVTYIGHATLLIELGQRRLLTDPNFDPALGKFLRRVSLPGIPLGDLPKLDAILLTHAHADHLSFNSLDALPSDIPLFAPPAIAKSLLQAVPEAPATPPIGLRPSRIEAPTILTPSVMPPRALSGLRAVVRLPG